MKSWFQCPISALTLLLPRTKAFRMSKKLPFSEIDSLILILSLCSLSCLWHDATMSNFLDRIFAYSIWNFVIYTIRKNYKLSVNLLYSRKDILWLEEMNSCEFSWWFCYVNFECSFLQIVKCNDALKLIFFQIIANENVNYWKFVISA